MTKRLWKIAVLLLLATAIVAGWHLPAAHASNPTTVSFQGKVVNANGTNVTDGTYTFVFKLYSASSGGTALWTETDSLSVTAGVFQVNLGTNCPFFTANACNSSTPIDFSSSSSLYLGITFNSDPAGEMSPRVQLQSVPYAYYADNAGKLGGLTSSQYVQLSPGSAQSGFINLIGGNSTINASGTGTTTIGGGSGTTTIGGASAGAISLQTGGTNTIALQSANALNFTAGAASTWNLGSNTLAIASSKFSVDATGNLTVGTKVSVGTIGTASGAFVIDAGNNINSGASIGLHNNSAGGNAFTSFAAYNDNAGTTTHYGLFGIGGSAYTGLSLIQNSTFVLAGSGTSGLVLDTQAALPIIFATNNTQAAQFDGSGNLEIGTSAAATARLVVQGAGATSATTALNVTNSTPTSLFSVRDDGQITIGTFSTTGIVHSSSSGVLTDSAVALGTDTSGNYVASLGTLTGLSTTGNSGAGSTPTLSVQYGSAANTAVQGNVTLTCTGAGTNLSGGGTVITEGSGGTCANLAVVNNPTFSGLVTGQAGLTVSGGAVNLNVSSNNAVNIGTGTTTSAVTIGGGSNSISLGSNTTLTTGKSLTVNGDAFTDLTGSGLQDGSNALGINLTASGTTATTSSGSGLEFATTGGGLSLLRGCTNGQLLKWTGSSSTWGCAADNTGLSDSRLKTNVVDQTVDLDLIKNLRVVTYNFKCTDPTYTSWNLDCDSHTGVIAQELQTVFPQAVVTDPYTGYNEVNFDTVNFLTLKAVSELAGMISDAGNAAFNNLNAGGNLVVTGTTKLSGLGTGVLHNTSGGTLTSGAVTLGADTAGNYVATLGTLTGLSATGNTGAGSSPALSILYGAAANTAVQGNKTISCAAGTGNLTGGGTAVTLGNGGTCGSINTVSAPTFSGNVSGASFSVGGTAGITVTCTGTNYLSAPVISGGLYVGNGGCRAVGLSDERIKKNIVSLDSSVLDSISQVNPVNFEFDCSNSYFSESNTVCDSGVQTGVIAQQLMQIFPQLVSQDQWGYYHVDYQGLSVEALAGEVELAHHIDSAGNANLATTRATSVIAPSLTSDGALSLDSGASGDVSVDAGSAANVNIGTGLAAAVNLSRPGQTTTVGGGLVVNQAGDFAGDVTIGGKLSLSQGFSLVNGAGQPVISFDNSGNANFDGNLNLASANVSGGLSVGGDFSVGGLSTFQKLATFLAKTVFRQDVEFDGHLTVASDSAGYAQLRAGEATVHVTFTTPYDNPPVVTSTIVNGQFGLVSVNNVTTQGFDLSLSQPATADTTLSWTAIGVNNPQTAVNPTPTPAP